ncbi:MAG: hypothetical protein AB7I41_25345 [Candidatus Sericytochromatia bacterium]
MGTMLQLSALHNDLNAFTFSYPDVLLCDLQRQFEREIRPFFEDPAQDELLRGGKYQHMLLPGGNYSLCSYDTDPLFWVANRQASNYALFKAFFDALGLEQALKPKIKHKNQLVMYCGFFVVGNQAPDPNWHYDYRPGAPAYTLITPLFDLSPEHGQLLYELPNRQRQVYRYTPNQAIVFGEGFLHSTEPYGPSPNLRVLLSLTCGTDIIDYWPILKQNIEEQSDFYALPCGHFRGSCRCLEPNFWHRWKALFKT